MIFLTTGEKIRNLRKKFGMRQQELEDQNITRAFISMIETGKRGLSRDTARQVAEKINKKAESIGVYLNIDENYLLRTPSEDAEVYCLQKLNNTPTKDEIDVIVEVSKKYNLIRVEAQAYKYLGDYDFEARDYSRAFINYMVSLDLYKNTDENRFIAYLYNQLGLCKYEQLAYIEANCFFSRAKYYAVFYKDIKIEKYAIYNIARGFKRLEKFDDTIKYIEKFLECCNKEEEFNYYIHANVIKADCYNYWHNKEEAINILKKLMGEFTEDNRQLQWYVYSKLGSIYLDENKLEESLKCFDQSQKISEKSCRKNLPLIYIKKAKVFIKKNDLNEALNFANKGLTIASEFNDIITVIDIYYKLIDIYTILKDFNRIRSSYIKLIDIIKNNDNYREEVKKIYTKLASLYLQQNDVEMCKKYLNMSS